MNIKTGNIRFRKTFTKGISPFEIVNRLIINIEMPKQEETVIEKTVVLKENIVKEIFLEEL